MVSDAHGNSRYVTIREIAAREGIREASVRSQLRAMRQRKKNPVDLRVPAELMPAYAARDATLCWRVDVEAWLSERAARRERRASASSGSSPSA